MSNTTTHRVHTSAAGAAEDPEQAEDAAEQPRTVRHASLYITRIDPWSVMKNAFMLSLAVAIVSIVAIMVLWGMLTLSGTISGVSRTVTDVAGQEATGFDLTNLLSFSRVMGTALIVAAIEVVLLSALATLFAYLYNLAVALTGGIQVTLTDDR